MSSRGGSNKHFKMFCKVCFDAGESKEVFTSHFVRESPNPKSKVTCPLLLGNECQCCGEIGHTPRYCPKSTKKGREVRRQHLRRTVSDEIMIVKPLSQPAPKISDNKGKNKDTWWVPPNAFPQLSSSFKGSSKPKVASKVYRTRTYAAIAREVKQLTPMEQKKEPLTLRQSHTVSDTPRAYPPAYQCPPKPSELPIPPSVSKWELESSFTDETDMDYFDDDSSSECDPFDGMPWGDYTMMMEEETD